MVRGTVRVAGGSESTGNWWALPLSVPPGTSQWGPPDKRGWWLWGEPFTLPVTRADWPGTLARSIPAPIRTRFSPTGTCSSAADGSALHLLSGMSSATEQDTLAPLTHQP